MDSNAEAITSLAGHDKTFQICRAPPRHKIGSLLETEFSGFNSLLCEPENYVSRLYVHEYLGRDFKHMYYGETSMQNK